TNLRISYRFFLHDTKQVPVWIGQDYIVRGWRVSPRRSPRAEPNQPLDLSSLITSVEIKVQPTPRSPRRFTSLERQVRSSACRISKHHPASTRRLLRFVEKRVLPELDHALEFVAMNDDRSNSNGWWRH